MAIRDRNRLRLLPGGRQLIVEVKQHVLIASDAAHVMLAHYGHLVVERGDVLVHVRPVGQLEIRENLPHAVAVLRGVVIPVAL